LVKEASEKMLATLEELHEKRHGPQQESIQYHD